jgi:chromosomal replication initiation ATPase DnaA
MQQEVGQLLRAALHSGGRVLCAAGCSPAALPVLAAALRALPEGCLVSLRPPSVAEMRRIVVAMARAEGARLEPPVLASIATAGRGDVRRAAGALSSHRFARSQ